MDTRPLVSIVIPVFNDAHVIATALDTCCGQSLTDIEVIVVDDASTDGTASIVEEYASKDPRVRLVRQASNASAYQARRVGVLAATAGYVMFLDGDDELAPTAAAVAFSRAIETDCDLVQFGIDVVGRNGQTGGGFESRLQPRFTSLRGSDVLRQLFPIDSAAQGQLWKYLFRRQLLVDAYALMPDDLVLPRVNDLPIAFLAVALADRYESAPDRLYRYHFGLGGSGQKVKDLETAAFYAGAIRSIDSIAPAVEEIARSSAEPDLVRATYASVRRAIIGYTTHYIAEHTRAEILDDVIADLYTRASPREIVHATAQHWPENIDALAEHASAIALAARPVRNVLIATNHLSTGGISGVVVAQARLLDDAGYRVTVVARDPGSDPSLLPAGARFVEVGEERGGGAVTGWADLCVRDEIDLVIEHQWQYSRTWHMLALAARAEGVPTIGWSHNFAGRSILFGLGALGKAPKYFALLAHLVVLSPLDVVFWKLRGMPRVSYLPNPSSALVRENGIASAVKPPPVGRRLELIWWGRLHEQSKRVTELIDVAGALAAMGVDFRLRIVGPDWRDMSAARLNALARERGLGHQVHAIGPLHGADLLAAIDGSDILVLTSAIEGYPLTIPEAQSRGLPVAMYRLPWLALAANNAGILTADWGDARTLARAIADIARDADAYTAMSAASLTAAANELARDFGTYYRDLLSGRVSADRSPEPTIEDVEQLLALTVMFAELHTAKREKPGERARNRDDGRSPETSHAVRRLLPTARAVLEIAPWLRPTAHRVQRFLARRK